MNIRISFEKWKEYVNLYGGSIVYLKLPYSCMLQTNKAMVKHIYSFTNNFVLIYVYWFNSIIGLKLLVKQFGNSN